MSDRSRATYALWVLFAINALNFFDRQIGGALAEPIRKEWGLSDGALGALGTIDLAVQHQFCSAAPASSA